jgi:hypothetical protein
MCNQTHTSTIHSRSQVVLFQCGAPKMSCFQVTTKSARAVFAGFHAASHANINRPVFACLLRAAQSRRCTYNTSRTHSDTPLKGLAAEPPKRYKTIAEMVNHLCPASDRPRTVKANVPRLAIEEDVRQLFEESNFSV